MSATIGLMPRSRTDILQELGRVEATLAKLERAREKTKARIELLHAEFAGTSSATPTAVQSPPTENGKSLYTAAGKVKLFRSLFRGRTDVFPTRFVSNKTGKPGYSQACSNNWEPGLCQLRTGGKCSDGRNQAFVPMDDQVVIDHLQGRHVIGAYPLLEDETCWFLPADVDEHTWKEDTAAFAETRPSVGTPLKICSMSLQRSPNVGIST
jgi:hypothetical protein